MSVSLGLGDFAFGLDEYSDLHFSDKQIMVFDKIFVNIQMTEVLLLKDEIFRAGEKQL